MVFTHQLRACVRARARYLQQQHIIAKCKCSQMIDRVGGKRIEFRYNDPIAHWSRIENSVAAVCVFFFRNYLPFSRDTILSGQIIIIRSVSKRGGIINTVFRGYRILCVLRVVCSPSNRRSSLDDLEKRTVKPPSCVSQSVRWLLQVNKRVRQIRFLWPLHDLYTHGERI